jgi:hypothetical protein
MPQSEAPLEVRLSKRDWATLRRMSGKGKESQLVKQIIREWLQTHSPTSRPAHTLDELVGAIDGPAKSLAAQHDRVGLGSD